MPMQRVQFYRYTVEPIPGNLTNSFPIDMLRYDQAYPASNSEAVDRISASLMRDYNYVAKPVELIGTKSPTEARWRSFGWRVVAESVKKVG